MSKLHWHLDARCTLEERYLAQELARRRGLTLSALLRSLVMHAVREEMDRERLMAQAYPDKHHAT